MLYFLFLVDMKSAIYQKGFSTLEMLLAMSILILVLTAVILVSFGNQSMIINSRTNAEALNIAQGLLEKAQSDARKDFNLVNPVATTTTDDGFASSVNVVQTDYFTKLVTATVEFPEDSGRRGTTVLSAVVTNFNNAVGGDTCSSILLPNADAWKNPHIKNTINNDFTIIAEVSGDYAISDVDAYEGKLYVTIGKTPHSADPTFFVFDIPKLVTDPLNALIGKIDNASSTVEGLNAVAVAEDTTNHKIYAYVANNSPTNQLQVIDVTDPDSITPEKIVDFDLDNVGGTQGIGNSIFFKDGYIYLGLQATGIDEDGNSNGPEFHIIDAHLDRAHPAKITGRSYYSVGNAVNAISVRGKYAYLATSNDQELIVLDVHDPSCVVTNPQESESVCKPSGTPPWGFNEPGSSEGKSLYFLGNNLYLGKVLNNTEFYILDNSNSATNTFAILGLKDDINVNVDGISIRENLAFLLLKTGLKIFNISDVSQIEDWGDLDLTLYAGSDDLFEPSLDCEGNNFFVGSNIGGHGYLSIIAP